ncbi:MAG: OB-fold domain-containing protein [Chloroflexi bacterium]|nr:OB-fold domain-containing protein [Chloroflexota bacterium]
MNDSRIASPAATKDASQQRAFLRGSVYSYARVLDPPAGFEESAPYYLALIRLDDGQLVTAQLTDVERTVAIGDSVEMVTRKLTTDGQRGVIVYGYKFRPVIK